MSKKVNGLPFLMIQKLNWLFIKRRSNCVYSDLSNKPGVLITCMQGNFPKSNNRGGFDKVGFYLYLLHITVLGVDFSEIFKRGGSNKASRWEKFIKKIRLAACLFERSEYLRKMYMPTTSICKQTKSIDSDYQIQEIDMGYDFYGFLCMLCHHVMSSPN